MVEREAEWDDEALTDAASFLAYEDRLCNGCGKDLELTTRQDVNWDINHDMVCRHCAALAVAERMEEDKLQNEKPIPGRSMWAEGRLVTSAPVFPKPKRR